MKGRGAGATQTSGTGGARLARWSLVVFLGGCCYGAQASVVKLAYAAGFTFGEVTFAQNLVGFCLFLLVNIVMDVRRTRTKAMRDGKDAGGRRARSASLASRPTLRQALRLAATGMVTCCTGLAYYGSLTLLPASVGITLLFQFTWIGIVIGCVSSRTLPSAAMVASGAIVVVGTLFASGAVAHGTGALAPAGIALGLVAAVCCATFMYLSGHVETQLPAWRRSLFVALGALVLSSLFCPEPFAVGAWQRGLLPYALMLGGIGFVGPVFLFAWAAPHLPTGVSTIMASSELPFSVVCSHLILGEPVLASQTAGVVAILVGVVVSQAGELASLRGEHGPSGS